MKKNEIGPLMPGMVFGLKGNTVEIKTVEERPMVWSDSVSLTHVGINNLQPIPLTPDILRGWFGAIPTQENAIFRITHLQYAVIAIKEEEGIYQMVSAFGHKVVRFVHQFQRLLAGWELDHTVKMEGGKDE